MSSALLTLQATLVLSLQSPVTHPTPGGDLWFSDPKIIQAESVSGGVLLRPRARGLVHAAGLKPGQNTRILIVSPANYRALARCPQVTELSEGNYPRISSLDAKLLQRLHHCGFDEVALSPTARHRLEAKLLEAEARVRRAGLGLSAAEWQGERRLLKLPAGNHTQARYLLGDVAPFYELQAYTAPKPGRTLSFQITLFEFSRRRAKQIGVRWPSSVRLRALGGAGLWDIGFGDGKNSGDLEIGADFGESLGVGRVLAQPNVRSKPGVKATFQSGGEIPIKTATRMYTNTVWKKYGLIVEITPKAEVETGAGEVSVAFSVELSEPDMSTAVDGVPGMLVRKLDSEFDLRVGENTILSTLIQTRNGENRNGVPGLSRIPILNVAFASSADFESDSELWFALKPSWEELPAKVPYEARL